MNRYIVRLWVDCEVFAKTPEAAKAEVRSKSTSIQVHNAKGEDIIYDCQVA
jgi:hypothetical protein